MMAEHNAADSTADALVGWLGLHLPQNNAAPRCRCSACRLTPLELPPEPPTPTVDQNSLIQSSWGELVLAARLNQTAKVAGYIEAGACVDARDQRGMTIVMVAAQRGNLELVELCVAAGAQLNATSNAGWTAVTLAMLHRQGLWVLRALLQVSTVTCPG